MGLKEISDPTAIERAMDEFDEIGRDGFLSKYGFRRSRRFYIDRDGLLYDSKPVLSAAHAIEFPDAEPLEASGFSGGESTTAKKLTDLGFTVVSAPVATAPDEDPLPIGDLIGQVLELQQVWTRQNTPEMAERGRLVRTEIPKSIRSLLPPSGALPFDPSVRGGDGSGSKNRVPWVRVYSETHAPTVTDGWYVVLLFAADGSRAYLTLGSGISRIVDSKARPRPREWIDGRIKRAREILVASDTSGLLTEIALADPGGLGEQYERGTVLAAGFAADDELDDQTFREVLARLLELLSELYTHDTDDAEDEDHGSSATTHHLLLKWNPTEDAETIEKHEAVADAHSGHVWWGSFTKGDPPRRVGDARVKAFRAQIEAGEETFAYLYRLGPSPAVHRARVAAITNDRAEVDEARVPSYYGLGQHHNVYVLLHDIEPFPLDELLDNVALAIRPIAGSLGPALKNQTSPMYVVHLDETTGPGPEAGLTKEWLFEQTLWKPEQLDDLLDVLLGPQPQVILAGPPGTGKTWVAQAVARYLTKDRHAHWRLVQFHPSFSYESFVEGLRPVADQGAIKFERVDGVVLRMARAALTSSQPHVLVIDELNRANVPRVLGELMYLFEYRSETIDLQYSLGFALPKNIAFIATMNTADRSIRSIDVALRRRFEIFECLPDPDVLAAYYAPGGPENFVPSLVGGFVALNDELTDQLDKHHTIGHTFFMAEEMTPARLRRVWDRKIRPLIDEYFFDAPDLAEKFTVDRFWGNGDA